MADRENNLVVGKGVEIDSKSRKTNLRPSPDEKAVRIVKTSTCFCPEEENWMVS